jgi:hypothetical protein
MDNNEDQNLQEQNETNDNSLEKSEEKITEDKSKYTYYQYKILNFSIAKLHS